jgi:hypothetical protein
LFDAALTKQSTINSNMTKLTLRNTLKPGILITVIQMGVLCIAPNAFAQDAKPAEVKPAEEKKKWEIVAAADVTLTRGNSHNFPGHGA